MAKKKPEPDNLAEEVVPDLLPLPTVIREFKPALVSAEEAVSP